MKVNDGYRKYVLVAFIVVVIILSGFFYIQYFKQGSADLSITSAIVQPGYYANSNGYTLHIDLHIKFNGQMTVTGYLNVCSFDIGLNSSLWSYYPIYCTGEISTLAYSGSHDFTLNFGIEPSIKNSTISTPFNLSFNVYSNAFNVTSPFYNLAVTNSSKLQASLKITQVSLDNITNQYGEQSYNISTTLFLTSNHSFNVSDSCSSPFSIIIKYNLTTRLNYFGTCGYTYYIYYFPSGTSKYTLTTQLYNPPGQEFYNVTFYPGNSSVQIILGNYFLESNVYTF